MPSDSDLDLDPDLDLDLDLDLAPNPDSEGSEASEGPDAPDAPDAPSPDPDAQHLALARWIAEAERDPNPARLWRFMSGSSFAHRWYGMRATGEMLRGEALRWLYLHQRHPGGPHPDPRTTDATRAPFSQRAILVTAVRHIVGLSIWPISEAAPEAVPTATADLLRPAPAPSPAPDSPKTLCWLQTYPDGRPPAIAVRHPSAYGMELLFDMAQLLGYAWHEQQRLADPDAPGGTIRLPHDTAIETVLHQFAIALLGLPPDCPPNWPCACNSLRARYNAVPRSHEEPTEALSLADLYASRRGQPPRDDEDQ